MVEACSQRPEYGICTKTDVRRPRRIAATKDQAQSESGMNKRRDLPDGLHTRFCVQPPLEKYFVFRLGRNSNTASISCPDQRGVSRSSRTLGAGCDGRSASQCN